MVLRKGNFSGLWPDLLSSFPASVAPSLPPPVAGTAVLRANWYCIGNTAPFLTSTCAGHPDSSGASLVSWPVTTEWRITPYPWEGWDHVFLGRGSPLAATLPVGCETPCGLRLGASQLKSQHWVWGLRPWPAYPQHLQPPRHICGCLSLPVEQLLFLRRKSSGSCHACARVMQP